MNWYLTNGPESDVVISTRIRFARNIKDINFINKCDNEDLEKILNIAKEKLSSKELKFYRLNDMDDITRLSLVEKHCISPDILRKGIDSTGILINDNENISIMVNEEDHLRIQVISSGLQLENNLNLAHKYDEEISKKIKYAYSEKYGYLTSCPTNVGTGMRASVMLHLPALTMTRRIGKVLDVMNKIGINVRGIYGEGTDSEGNMYQISNKVSLGLTCEEIVQNLNTVIEKIIVQERNARKYLSEKGIDFEDRICRAYGILANARKMSSKECNKLVSDVKLGIDLGIITNVSPEKINKLNIYTKPASLQKYLGEVLTQEERDIKRCEVIKNILK